MVGLGAATAEKTLDDKIWVPRIEEHIDSEIMVPDMPEIVYTAAPLCIWSRGNEPVVDELFERIRTERLGIKITILTGVNWWGLLILPMPSIIERTGRDIGRFPACRPLMTRYGIQT